MRWPVSPAAAVTVLLFSGVAALANDQPTLTTLEHWTSIIEWVESKGGYFSSKIALRTAIPGDPSSHLGMYLKDPVDKDEVLMVIPKECMLTTGTESTHWCDTVTRLKREYELGESSDFYPFVRYSLDPRHDNDLPQAWTPKGKELLHAIAGKELLPRDLNVTGMTYEESCGDRRDTSGASRLERSAYLSVLRRSWEDKMIPVFDFVNHRNPPYNNVDSNPPLAGEDVRVVALRDIDSGEQMHLSYNECTTCRYRADYAYTYVNPYLLRDYGFVEQYPQRWTFFDLRFELEERRPGLGENSNRSHHSGSRLKLRWLNDGGPPSLEEVEEKEYLPHLYGHLKLLQSIDVEEFVRTHDLPSHEAYTSRRFRDSLIDAMKHVIWHMEDMDDEAKVGGTVEHPVVYGVGVAPLKFYSDEHDEVNWTARADPDLGSDYHVKFNTLGCSQWYLNRVLMKTNPEVEVELETSKRYELLEVVETYHQKMTFWQTHPDMHEDPLDRDVMFKIGRNWESCQVNRAHYHEVFVHYPASYVPTVKRVLFLGGGDNMILHEVLKYDTLELVVGLELDKGVNQASFRHFETSPHFDDPRVEWWFGDAKLTLTMLPESYLGSFDLVYVDVQNFIVTQLKLMEVVSRYAHPLHGLIQRNEDNGWGSNDPYATHTVDAYDGDVPVYCLQPFTMGSNGVDFTTSERTAHDVENLYYEASEEGRESQRFKRWYNYRKTDRLKPSFSDLGLEEAPKAAGVLLVLELEQVSPEKISLEVISDALQAAGMSLLETKASFGDDNTSRYVAREGYVMARVFPNEHYVAFDVLLWSNYEITYEVEKGLSFALESSVTSSYRIVTNGVFGVARAADEKSDSKAEERATDEDSCKKDEYASTTSAVDSTFALPIGQSHTNAALERVSSSLLSLQSASTEVLVLCGQKDEPCGALDVAEKRLKPTSQLTSVHACPASKTVFACEADLRASIRAIRQRGHVINAILIDAAAPQQMGQVLHRILDRSEYRGQVLSDKIVVAGVTVDQWSTSSWMRVLLDEFRTEFYPYNPSFHAEVIFRPGSSDTCADTYNESEEALGVGVYAAGNRNFYSVFTRAVGDIANATGLTSDLRYVRNGLNNFVADFEPTKEFSRGDYDTVSAKDHRHSQKIMGRQTVLQCETEGPKRAYRPPSIAEQLETVIKSVGVKRGMYELHAPTSDYFGEGSVIFASWEGGDVTIVHDGRSKLDLKLFTLDQDTEFHAEFEGAFVETMPEIWVVLKDVQPRGAGRVVAFGESPWD